MQVTTQVFFSHLIAYRDKTGKSTFLISEVFPEEQMHYGRRIAPRLDGVYENSELSSCAFWGILEYRQVGDDFEVTIIDHPTHWGGLLFDPPK